LELDCLFPQGCGYDTASKGEDKGGFEILDASVKNFFEIEGVM